MAAGEGDAEAIFASLPPWLREAVTRDLTDANPSEARIVESYCGNASHEEHAADLLRREEIMRRGIVSLQRVASGRDGGGTEKGGITERKRGHHVKWTSP
jgi:hypothetical protein